MVGNNILYAIPIKITKTGGVLAARFVLGDGSDYASTTSQSPGVTLFPVNLNEQGDIQTGGIAIVESVGTIHVGDKIMAEDATGKAKAYSGTYGTVFPHGKALDAASAGEFIRVQLS